MIDYDMFRVGGSASLVLSVRHDGRMVKVAEQDGPAGGLLIGRDD